MPQLAREIEMERVALVWVVAAFILIGTSGRMAGDRILP
jgi:hypothetical protein